MTRAKLAKKEERRKKDRLKVNFTGQNTITRDKREFLLRETTDDQRQSQAEICLPFNGTVFPDCFFFFCFCVITLVALANRGNRPRDRRFPRKLNISSVTWPHNFSLPHDARLSPRIIPRDTFDPVTFPSRYSRHEGSFFHSRTPNLPPLLSNRRSFLKRNPIVSAVRLSARDCSTILYVNERTIFDKKAIISSISFNYTEA